MERGCAYPIEVQDRMVMAVCVLYNFIRRVELGDMERKQLCPTFRNIRNGKFAIYTDPVDNNQTAQDTIKHTYTIPKPNKEGYKSDYARLKRIKALHNSVSARMWDDAVALRKPIE